jgi:hypothetical protein
VTLVDTALERTFVATLIARPALLAEVLGDFDSSYLGDFQAKCAFEAWCDLAAAKLPINGAAVAERLEARGYVSAVTPYMGWLPRFLGQASVAAEPPVAGWAVSLVRIAALREQIVAEDLDE